LSRRSKIKLLEYTRFTLRLIELHSHLEEDASVAVEVKSALQRYISELENETAHSQSIFGFLSHTE
jgi:hypothetical protein